MESPEQEQTLSQHYTHQFATLLQEFRMALAHLPKPHDEVPLPQLQPAASSVLAHLEEREGMSSWSQLSVCLQIVWEGPAGVQMDAVSRDKGGALHTVSRLLDRIGAEKLAVLPLDERVEATNWICAFRDAVNSRSAILNDPAAAQRMLNANANAQAQAAPREVPSHRIRQTATPRTSSESANSLLDTTTLELKPLLDPEAPESDMRGQRNGPSPGWAAPPPPPLQAAAPRPFSQMPRASSTHRKLASSAPRRKSITGPSGTIPTRPSPFGPPPVAAPKKRKTSASVTPRRVRTISTEPQPPRQRDSSVSESDRPQRARKTPKRLEEGEETVVKVFAEDRDQSSSDDDDGRFPIGSPVMAKFPNYSWWPAIILSPSSPPKWTQGSRKADSFLIKSIPTGGDHRWVQPNDVRELTEQEVNEVIIPGKYEKPPPVSWRTYRADLIDGCLIAMDKNKLDEWSHSQTESDFVSQQKAERRKSTV